MTKEECKALQIAACQIRMGVIESTHGAKAGHPGGSLSAADMFAYLYNKEMRIDPQNPQCENRDRFVLSKGHTAPGLYSALAYRGFFPVADLPTLRHIDSYLQGHPNMNTVPGVDMSTGSLGQGVSAACGMALAARLQGAGVNVYTHGEMLPAHAYPELKKYPHLKGNFGTAWQNQQKEFNAVPAPILFTTNCLMPVRRAMGIVYLPPPLWSTRR